MKAPRYECRNKACHVVVFRAPIGPVVDQLCPMCAYSGVAIPDAPASRPTANDRQEGGTHYQGKIQPWDAIIAWGVKGEHLDRHRAVCKLLKNYTLHCLAVTTQGYPNHPLYLAKTLQPIPYR